MISYNGVWFRLVIINIISWITKSILIILNKKGIDLSKKRKKNYKFTQL